MTKAKTNDDRTMAAWLETRNRRTGIRRIEKLGWKRLAGIYSDAAPSSGTRRIINAEARRCGYAPRTILGLNHPNNAL